MPRETWPMIQAHWCQPKGFLGMSEYFQCLPQSAAEAAACRTGAHGMVEAKKRRGRIAV